uniref:Uncharacterized protein n=1 Tax=Anguilla anguilla TaxID=7936 RepID=A0A0E9QGX0_ANGAN
MEMNGNMLKPVISIMGRFLPHQFSAQQLALSGSGLVGKICWCSACLEQVLDTVAYMTWS